MTRTSEITDPTQVPVTAGFMRILAAMVSGWPEGDKPFYMVVTWNGKDFDVLPDPVRGAPSPWYFQNPVDAEREAGTRRHSQLAVQVVGPFSAPYDPTEKWNVNVVSVRTQQPEDPKAPCLEWSVPADIDLLCWTPAAFDKFIAPYYYGLLGSSKAAADKVQELRARMQETSGIMGHRWPTSPTTLEAFSVVDGLQNPQDRVLPK